MINISIKKPKPVLVMVHNASKGLRGVGLSGVTLDKDGNLIFTMSDGTVQTIKGYSQDLVNTTNEINNIKEEVSTIANNAADSAKEAKETADSIKQEYDRVEGATNSGLALIERSVLYGINRVKEATKACKSDALANIELAHKDAIDDIAIRRLEALQDIAGANAAAVSSAAAAKTSETNAETSNQMAKKWAESTESPDGATDSDSSTGNTQSSKSWALHSKSNASAAKVSETNAKTSETNASKSATAAKVSETNAKGSETASAISEANAKTSESNAASSASSASDSEAGAATQASNAAKSATSASSYASSAKTSEANAKLSETHSASSASSASTSASNAKTSETNAKTSATSASTSASNAAKAEVAAKTAQAAAEKARDDANSAVAKVTGAMKYAGQVDNYSDLSDVIKNTGDVWNIVNADPEHGIKAGDNVAWNGTDWDDLSGTVDLSIYAEKADYQKAITSATANGATITFNHKDGTTSTATVNNVASATAATNDAKGQKIDTTYEKVADASNVHTSLQNSINSLSTSKQDKLTFDLTPTADSSNPVTSSGIKTALDGKPSNTGAGASGTWPISVSGNASTATKATNDGNGNPIASTYLPLSGGTLTGVVNGVTPTAGDNSKKLATTEFVANTYATKRDVANTYLDKLSKTEQVVTAPIKGTLNGNASSATKLATARTINVTDADGTNTGTGASFDGSGNATIKLPAKIKATLTGNADTATKLETARTINIQDATSAHTGTGASFNGTANATIKLPNTIDANITGAIRYVHNGKVFVIGKTDLGNVDIGWNYTNKNGAGIGLRSTDYAISPGEFFLFARDSTNSWALTGKPDGTLTWNSQPLLPVGVVQAFAGTTIPNGWLLCDGSAVSRTTYASLYACIGTTYGSGDGSTTFNLPNLVDKFIEGSAKAGTVKSAGLPNITGEFRAFAWLGNVSNNQTVYNGCISLMRVNDGTAVIEDVSGISGHFRNTEIKLDASRSSSVYGNSTTVQPPALTMRYIIKY